MEYNSFVSLSRNIVDKFIRDIVFIDEQAYGKVSVNTEKAEILNNEFDAKAVSEAFLRKGKICAIYAPQTDEDVKECLSSLLKADAVVLDWNLSLERKSEYDPMADDESDNRGYYTKYLINKLIIDAHHNKVKLIVVYTGETDLEGITNQIYENVIKVDSNFKKEDCLIFSQSDNIRVLVRAKETTQFKHVKQLEDKIVEYDRLPDFIVNEFAEITTGLLPNYALSAITEIRDNTFNILGVFSKEIDPAFLGHYVSVGDIESRTILEEIFGCTVKDLIGGKSDDNFANQIQKWIEYKFNNVRTITIESKSYDVDSNKLNKVLKSAKEKLSEKLSEIGICIGNDKAKKNATSLFCFEDPTLLDHKFAQLVQHKNILNKGTSLHKLNLGTIVKTKKDNEEIFLLCIQQACDSTRISYEEGRNFLFLPLKTELKNGEYEVVVVDEKNHYLVDNKSYSVVIIHFKPEEDNSLILSKILPSEDVGFVDSKGQQYIWIAELKEILAQRIVDAYTSQLSRIGINNLEWIRLTGKIK